MLELQLYVWKRDLNLRDVSASWRVDFNNGKLVKRFELIRRNAHINIKQCTSEYNFVKLGEMKTDFEQKSSRSLV